MRGPELRRFYDEHAQRLYAFLLNLTRDEADTRDLLQDVFVKLARDPGLLNGVRDERAFLIRLAHNAAIDLIRRRGTRDKTREQFAAEIISPFAPASDPDEQTFRAALAKLIGPRDTGEADRSKSFVPQPRSERAEFMAA
jgi:RNA polymerase sigma-70 factor (ECF subfamily)